MTFLCSSGSRAECASYCSSALKTPPFLILRILTLHSQHLFLEFHGSFPSFRVTFLILDLKLSIFKEFGFFLEECSPLGLRNSSWHSLFLSFPRITHLKLALFYGYAINVCRNICCIAWGSRFCFCFLYLFF